MNLTLHWLRRDLRRHAPALALWALLVAAFTWARIWLRTHPDFFIGDRDLWLSVPAAAARRSALSDHSRTCAALPPSS